MSTIVGIDIGGTAIKFGLFDSLKDDFIDKWTIKTDLNNNGENILSDINKSVRHHLKLRTVDISQVRGLGFGVPGPVDSSGTVLDCVNLGWGHVNLTEIFGKLFPIKIAVDNDANVAALGEYWRGGGKNYNSIVFLTLGTGVGGGVIVDGQIVTGSSGGAGEVGNFIINKEETEYCSSGNRGCLEQYASATGIVNEAKKILINQKEPTKLKQINNITAKDIFDLAKEGDKVSMCLLDEFADKLGLACSYIACVVNPEAILIGGGVAQAGNILIEKIKEKFLKYAFKAHKNTDFRLAELENDAGIYGAVKLLNDKE